MHFVPQVVYRLTVTFACGHVVNRDISVDYHGFESRDALRQVALSEFGPCDCGCIVIQGTVVYQHIVSFPC